MVVTMSSGSDTHVKLACQIQICWKWEGRGLKCGTVPVMGPVAAPQMVFLETFYELGDTLPTQSTGRGQHGLPGHSAAATAAEASGTGSVFATTQNPSMGACPALAHPWSSRNATFYPAQWMVCGLVGHPGQNAQQPAVVDTT